MEFTCKTCSRVFKFQSGLSRHTKTHKPPGIKSFCGLLFSRRDNLQRHQMSSKTCTPLLDNGDNVEQGTPEPTAIYDTTKRFKIPSPVRNRSASPSIENPTQ